MACADYFDRAVQAAFHILGNLDQQAFIEKAESRRVAIAFDASTTTAEGDAAIDLTIRLTARFYPKIVILPLDTTAEEAAPKYMDLARRINPKIEIGDSLTDVTDTLVIGTTSQAGLVTPIYMGSDGWIAKFSRNEPVGSGTSLNPFGAGVAACLAAANLFRSIYTEAPLDDSITLSVLDLDPTATDCLNPELGTSNLGEIFLVGAGAIGNGFLWALSRCSNQIGTIKVVDHDAVDLFNIQRYILTERDNEGVSKVEKAVEIFEGHGGFQVTPVPRRWEEFVADLPDDHWVFDTVVSALDTPSDRVFLQASLPKWVVNAWTGAGDAGVSHHDFKNHACMACLYMPDGTVKNEDQLIAEALGFPQDQQSLLDLRGKIEVGWLVDRPFLDRVAAAKNIHVEKLLQFEGQTIRSLYSRGVCSGAVMELANGPVTARAEVPMPFQSALAGILQGAVVVAKANGYLRLPPFVRTNLMTRFPATRGFGWIRPKHGRCFCNDSDYQAAYDAKYQEKM